MKNKIAQFLMLVGLTFGLAVFAQAQTGGTYKANIPFSFIVGEKSFAAGDYSISFGLQGDRNKFIIRSKDGKRSAIVAYTVPKENGETSEDGKLVFYVSNEHYFLSEVNTRQTSVELPNSQMKKQEKEKRPEKKVEVALAR